ncbi:ATP-binding protein [Brevibacillus sp. AF8]|uniref:ATP-binding protein n=1 Tax=Brevibacillus sp. AF8 TaxID=2825881 RepID=UPI001E551E37
MTNIDIRNSILKGYQMNAEYQEQIVPENKGNPFIEAIPSRLSIDDIYDHLYSVPKYCGNHSTLTVEERLELVQQIKPSFWLPLTPHFERYRNIYTMIKIGYQSRNPMTAMYQRHLSVGYGNILAHGTNPDGTNLLGHLQTAKQCAEIGLSGMGKSKTYDKLLQLFFPQVIHHTRYQGSALPCKQVVWLKIECPSNRSIGALCRNFYYAVDEILGTTYYEDLAEKDGRAEVLAKRMAKVAGLINLGVLVIDEIQRVNRAHSGGDEKMIDFITELTNSIGVPIIMIGTFKAMYLFKTCLANCRRGVPDGYAENITDRMKENWEWEQFIESLWDLQYTKNITALTPQLKASMYYHTLGIPDFAVKLFMHVQSHVILYSENEHITVSMIDEVANKTLRLVQPIFERIRKGEDVDPVEFEDLKPDWISFDKYLSQISHKIQIDGQMSEEHKRIIMQRNRKTLIEQLTIFATKMGCQTEEAEHYACEIEKKYSGCEDTELLYSEIAKLVLTKGGTDIAVKGAEQNQEKATSRGRKNNTFEADDIRQIVQEGSRRGRTIDEALSESGVINTYDEFVVS